MFNMDFANIRNHDGSQNKGFEELVCQLAHLNPPEDASYFVRKEGDGGDAGVECYWKLNDDTEYAWQAKYFLDVITNSQWNQISKSVETALEKHPKLKKYYVCLPRDWTDSRKKINGKTVKSSWDKWVEHVNSWKELANKMGMDVEFKYWCKHEISQMLQNDKSEYAGRALYWFNTPVISNKILVKIAEKSKISLGERFTPEFNVDLPIKNKFDCLGLSKKWKKQLKDQCKILAEIKSKYNKILNDKIDIIKDKTIYKNLDQDIESFYTKFVYSTSRGDFFHTSEDLKKDCEKVLNNINTCNATLYNFIERENDEKSKKKYREISYDFRKIANKIEEVRDFLEDNAIEAGKNKSLLLLGEAGIGKSHLLCDITIKRLEESLPTLFLLGQHYPGGNPLEFICAELNLSNIPYRTVLGALDSLGESKETRFLIIIDAINEGVYREAWYDNIIKFLTELSDFPHIAIVLSCRTTYKNFLIPPNDNLVEIEHHGFRGFEHRAALKYLAKQGISKPGTPILTPEFTNPLFLKTSCKAIKRLGKDKFPKGISGFLKLFEFYIESIELVINRKKRYRSREHIVYGIIKKIVSSLYPDHISGLPVNEARKIVKKEDPNPNIGGNLFELMIEEGILAYDVIPSNSKNERGTEVVRFTYDRFSDYIIARYIIDNCNNESEIAKLFLPENEIGKIINEDNRYRYGGIIEALGIILPEKFNKEFIEFMKFQNEDKDKYEYNWFFKKTFTDTILWRTGNSITPKSLDMLNKIRKYGYNNQSLDILLALSTEPEHPWNADFLDKNLSRMDMPNRDAFWSTYVAINDQSEKEYGEESIVRTLIDWSLNAKLKNVESERLQLIAVVLLWMTTTSNRKVRDQVTKSLSRVLFHIPQKIVNIMKKFNNCDDIYLVQRMYAAVYGAILNLNNDVFTKEISNYVYKHLFNNNSPYPDILLRDYARGIMEFAYHRNLLNDLINSPEIFKPPYSSEWPIENPSIEEINNIEGNEFSSSIKSSLMGFPGDFGNYTMGCVHNWSPTPITEEVPKTGLDLKRLFAKKLPEEIQDRYEAYLDEQEKEYKQMSEMDLDSWMEQSVEVWKEKNSKNEKKMKEETWEELQEEIKKVLNDIENEEFRWINGLSNGDSSASFSRKWAQRWVCKKAYELGWTKDLFSEFEKTYTRSYDRGIRRIERIGKKYQWIAFHELLARLSDNLIWIDRGYSDVDDHKFFGPWQIDTRDIDPTIWIRKTGDTGWDNWDKEFWWQPFKYQFADDKLENQIEWLWDKTIVPSFKKLLTITNPKENKEWVVLKGFSKWSKEPINKKDIIPEQDAWYRINSCVIHKNNLKNIKKQVKNRTLTDPNFIDIPSTGHQGYFREYPWHSYYNYILEWMHPDDLWNRHLKISHHVPICQYEWESGSIDYSINENIRFYMPSPKLIYDLNLMNNVSDPGIWENNNGNGNIVFMDPSVSNVGPSYGLIKKDIIQKWLNENDLILVWLVGGEKNLYTRRSDKFYGRLVYNGFYTLDNDFIDGELWFEEQK